MNRAEPLLEINGLASGYGPIGILRAITLSVRAGEIVALLGSNGAGKSTLIRTLCGLLTPSAGSICWLGRDIAGASSQSIVAAGLVQVPEGRRIFPNLSVQDNLLLGSYRRGRAARQANLAAVIERFPRLGERARQAAGTLSGGEQQMLAIARALMAEPRLLILDEPSLGLSPKMVDTLFELISQLHRQGLAILLVEQHVAQSLALASRAYVLENGAMAFSGTPAQLLASDQLRRAYLGV